MRHPQPCRKTRDQLLTQIGAWRRWAAIATAATAVGCSSGPSRIKPPGIDAGDAGAEAIEMYDKDGDGMIAGSELDAAPGIKSALETIDVSPADGKVSAEEIAARVEAWQSTGIGVMAVSCFVTLDGQPLQGATVTFEPEPFLGENIKAGTAELGRSGSTVASIPKDQRPTSDTPPGLQLGLYRVRISKKENGQETVPAKYNEETVLGQQISPDDPAVAGQRVRFQLSTNTRSSLK
ncbi:MAG: hypothetical protein KDA44_06495 [Planctomycetales bacterium]|nr:hypothetical protein [Planctomycetales bacterium]